MQAPSGTFYNCEICSLERMLERESQENLDLQSQAIAADNQSTYAFYAQGQEVVNGERPLLPQHPSLEVAIPMSHRLVLILRGIGSVLESDVSEPRTHAHSVLDKLASFWERNSSWIVPALVGSALLLGSKILRDEGVTEDPKDERVSQDGGC